jgi:hypothetical protein
MLQPLQDERDCKPIAEPLQHLSFVTPHQSPQEAETQASRPLILRCHDEIGLTTLLAGTGSRPGWPLIQQ